jgi:peptidoglycan/xylan/chitin deacetylase (PgdA/CDA1 family)
MLNSVIKNAVALICVVIFAACGTGNTETAETSESSDIMNTETEIVTTTTGTVRVTREIDPEKPMIALTFDDGPNSLTSPAVLDKLEKYGAVGTFFLVGDNISDDTAAVMKRAYEMGCDIENHSKTHSDMTKMTPDEIAAEVKFTDDKIFDILGVKPSFFRPPYIAVNDVMYEAIDETFICGTGVEDYEPKVNAKERAKRVLAAAADGLIVLLHDSYGNTMTVIALDTIIPELQKQGYQFVTVAELFGYKNVTPEEYNMYTLLS